MRESLHGVIVIIPSSHSVFVVVSITLPQLLFWILVYKFAIWSWIHIIFVYWKNFCAKIALPCGELLHFRWRDRDQVSYPWSRVWIRNDTWVFFQIQIAKMEGRVNKGELPRKRACESFKMLPAEWIVQKLRKRTPIPTEIDPLLNTLCIFNAVTKKNSPLHYRPWLVEWTMLVNPYKTIAAVQLCNRWLVTLEQSISTDLQTNRTLAVYRYLYAWDLNTWDQRNGFCDRRVLFWRHIAKKSHNEIPKLLRISDIHVQIVDKDFSSLYIYNVETTRYHHVKCDCSGIKIVEVIADNCVATMWNDGSVHVHKLVVLWE